MMRNIIKKQSGKEVVVEPKIILEVGYEEIQKSPKYKSGYALRFPRLLRLREDKSPSDANTVNDIEKLFFMQKKRK